MKKITITLIVLFVLATTARAQTSVPPPLLFGAFEMLSNGNGPINILDGFDVTTPTVSGAYSADWYRDVLQSPTLPPSILQLSGGMQVAGGWYFVVAGGAGITDYETAANRWARNGLRNLLVVGNTYEIRFTAAGGKAIMQFTTQSVVDVPFELWYLASTPNDPSDDVRMIPALLDDDFDDEFTFKPDHQADEGDNDPYSDWIYFFMPDDASPGQAGYDQFVLDSDISGAQEHLARVILMNWDRHQNESASGAGDGPEGAMPETGTTFRLSVTAPGAIAIDIKPGSDSNTINCDKREGVLPVAVLTTDTFDARQIDPSTVMFGLHNAREVHGTGHLSDVDGDGDKDMVFHFKLGETGITCTDVRATILGETLGGDTFFGFDAIQSTASPLDCGLADPAEHDYNEVRVLVDVDGNIARTNDRDAHFFFPGGTCDQYVYAAGPMIGGLVNGTPIVAEATFSSEFVPSEIGSTGEFFRVFNSKFSSDKQNWPPEFSDSKGKPLIVSGAQNLVVQYSDVAGMPLHGVGPLGIEIRQRSLAYKGPARRDAIIFIWEISNTSSEDIEDAYFGFWADHDIGTGPFPEAHYDDRASVVNDMAIVWDDNFFEPDFSEQPAIMGFDFLETPGNAGLANFSVPEFPFDSGNTTDDVQYEYLKGIRSLEVGEVVGDLRFLVSTGLFNLEAGSSALVAAAVLFGRAPDGTTALSVDPNPPFRPDPDDPVLADLLDTQDEVQTYYDNKLRGRDLPKRGDTATMPESDVIPDAFALHQNHPNPFNPTTKIRFEVPESKHVKLVIYDVLGREVHVLVDGIRETGTHEVIFEMSGLPSGTYFYGLRAGVFTETKAMILLK